MPARLRTAAFAVLATATLAGCTRSQPTAAIASPPTATPTAHPTATPTTPPVGWVLPDRAKTPGAVHGTALADICPHVLPALEAGRPGPAVKARVYASYGITRRAPGQYEIDHLVPLELDGANDVTNLWPEPNDHPHATAYGHPALNSKDLLENKLHTLVCSGAVPLAKAQHDIAADWMAAYRRYVGPPPN